MKRIFIIPAIFCIALLAGCDNPLGFLNSPTPTSNPSLLPPAVATNVTSTLAATPPASSVSGTMLNPTEQQVFNLLDQQRTNAGLQPTTLDRSLIAIARARSQDMADRNYFAHVNPDGKSFIDIIKQQGITYHRAGEIIAEDDYPADQTASVTVEGWMNSQEHHDIITTPEYTLVGVGEALKGNEHLYTAIYLKP